MDSIIKTLSPKRLQFLAVVQFLSSGKSLITSLSLTVLILTAEDVQAKETKGRKQVAANK